MTNRLLFLNGLAILMIPIHHATAYGLQAMFGWASATQTLPIPENSFWVSVPFFLTMAARQLDAFAVPAFLFISGYFVAFMARGKEGKVTLAMVLPRIKILIPPFLIWTAIRYILLRQPPTSVDEVLNPYHFIPLLIQFYLISPILVPLARKRPVLLLIAFAIIHLIIQGLRYMNNVGIDTMGFDALLLFTPRWTIFGQQPFWFPFGLVFGLHSRVMSPWIVQNKRKLIAGTILLTILTIGELFTAIRMAENGIVSSNFSGFTKTFFILFFILSMLSFDVPKNRTTKFINDIGSRSLGIYLANIPSIYVIAVLIYRLLPRLLDNILLYQAILVIVGLAIPLLLMGIARRSSVLRPYYRTIFG